MNMQKSALTNPKPARSEGRQVLSPADKGAKFEPFWSAAFGTDRASLARLRQADQKR